MSKPKIRVKATPETFNGVTRYAVYDHTGTRWTNHRNDELMRHSSLYELYGGGGTLSDEGFVFWQSITGETADDAIALHAPSADNYELLTEDTEIKCIRFTKLCADPKDEFKYYVLANEFQFFEVSIDRVGQYYTIHTLSGIEVCVLYNVIEQITFEDV